MPEQCRCCNRLARLYLHWACTYHSQHVNIPQLHLCSVRVQAQHVHTRSGKVCTDKNWGKSLLLNRHAHSHSHSQSHTRTRTRTRACTRTHARTRMRTITRTRKRTRTRTRPRLRTSTHALLGLERLMVVLLDLSQELPACHALTPCLMSWDGHVLAGFSWGDEHVPNKVCR